MDSISTLIERIIHQFHTILGENLIGIYLHGSLVLGGFNPHRSDLDFLVVIADPLDQPTRQRLIEVTLHLAIDAPPKGLEYSIVLQEHTLYPTFPTPFELHYSTDWHTAFQAGAAQLQQPSTDPDLPAHFKVITVNGRCVYGEPIAMIFGPVSDALYWAALRYDAEASLAMIEQAGADQILNLCRILAFRQERLVLSKYEGGIWGLITLDPRFHRLVQQALTEYQGASITSDWDRLELINFGAMMYSALFYDED